MQFLVEVRRIDPPQMPPHAELALVKATFELFAANRDPRIKVAYPYAGARAGVLIIEASTGDEVQDVVGALPYFPLVTCTYHPLMSVQRALRTLEEGQQALDRMMPAGAGTPSGG